MADVSETEPAIPQSVAVQYGAEASLIATRLAWQLSSLLRIGHLNYLISVLLLQMIVEWAVTVKLRSRGSPRSIALNQTTAARSAET